MLYSFHHPVRVVGSGKEYHKTVGPGDFLIHIQGLPVPCPEGHEISYVLAVMQIEQKQAANQGEQAQRSPHHAPMFPEIIINSQFHFLKFETVCLNQVINSVLHLRLSSLPLLSDAPKPCPPLLYWIY